MRGKMNWVLHGMLGIALLAASCGSAEKAATDAAVSAAQSAINAAQGEAAKYVPDQLKAAQGAIQIANDAVAKGDYRGALTAAKDAIEKAKDLGTAAVSKKEELTRNWTSFSDSAQKSLDAAKAKLDAYSHGAKMPAGLDKTKLAEAKAQYVQLKKGLAEAATAFKQGNIKEAATKAASLKGGLARLMELLKIKLSGSGN